MITPIKRLCFSVGLALTMTSNSMAMIDDDERRPDEHKSPLTAKIKHIEVIERPIRSAIPEVARGHEEIYEKFLKGVLVYRPSEGSDVGRIDLPIAALSNPLDGTFDLSNCGDTGEYLSISTGYRKGHNPDNKNKVEIWFAPWFLVDKEKSHLAQNHHMREILKTWDPEQAPIGIFCTWGGWNGGSQLGHCDYEISVDPAGLSSKNMYRRFIFERPPGCQTWRCTPADTTYAWHASWRAFHISFMN